ncbi:hypothetical protein [Methylocaldum szegediense]|uniref:Uncharacterized protein n=1 Tax=Methylocaldum szegediense TaxID=73780 RepID=A0ABN8XBX8_9GAMM|nr:hypothetical protein [Methylocaldum szegediense]CAI8959644.1 conserved exported protein of unknown function [Methylocaldum szegediense]
MKTITLGLLVMLLGESGSTIATEESIGAATKQLLKDSVKSAIQRETRDRVHVAAESVEKAKNLRESIDRASAALTAEPVGRFAGNGLQEGVREAAATATRPASEIVAGQLKKVASEAAKSGVKATENGIGQAKAINGQVKVASDSVTTAAKGAKRKAARQAVEKLPDLLR